MDASQPATLAHLVAIADRIDRSIELAQVNGTGERERNLLSVLGTVSAAIRCVVRENLDGA